jgi:hypothetical protein
MILRSATTADILAVILGLDRDAAAGVYASRADDDRFALYNDIVAARGEWLLVWVFITLEGEAVALIALSRNPHTRPVAELMFMARPAWRPHAAAVLRRCLQMRGHLAVLGITCLTLRLLDRHHVDLAKRLGFAFERVLPGHGRHGETFVQLAWTDADPRTLDARAAALGSFSATPARPEHQQCPG